MFTNRVLELWFVIMNHRLVIILVFFLGCVNHIISQKQNIYKLPIPRDIDECCEVLDQTYSDEAIAQLENIHEDSLMNSVVVIEEVNLIAVWKLGQGSRLSKYFIRHGFDNAYEMHETILVSYHRYLNSYDIDLKSQANKYKLAREIQAKEFEQQLISDSVQGQYIPFNLEDCFLTLNRLLQEEEIDVIKELPSSDAVIKFLPNLCDWLKDEWILNEPNRLQIYMKRRGVDHPYIMAGEILRYYYDWLHSNNNGWRKFDKKK